jgi:hypothetical protein
VKPVQGGLSGAVTLDSSTQVITRGNNSTGVLAQSIAGGGGNGGFSVVGGVQLASSGSANVGVGLGGAGGSGNVAASVTATQTATVLTEGDDSFGLVAQSIGGGGGNGGFNVAGSLGGSGGAAGSVGVGLGGDGGTGADAGSVTATATHDITTHGDRSGAFVAQSLGGGGGNGGFNVAGSITVASSGAGAVNVGLGGSGDSGWDGALVEATVNGLINTHGNNSQGVVAQSIGGGGGNGGFNVSAGGQGSLSGAGGIGVSLGGEGDGGGDGGAVTAHHDVGQCSYSRRKQCRHHGSEYRLAVAVTVASPSPRPYLVQAARVAASQSD